MFCDQLVPDLKADGYAGFFHARTSSQPYDGVALFYRTSIFEPVQTKGISFKDYARDDPGAAAGLFLYHFELLVYESNHLHQTTTTA